MKFSEVKIGARFKKDRLILFKINDNFPQIFIANCVSVKQGDKYTLNLDEEVELVTKCENCSNCSGEKDNEFCYKMDNFIRENLGDGWGLGQDPATFSCSLFEMKTE